MKHLLLITLLLSLVANIAAVWLVKKLYAENNAVRLDPLQLSVYPDVAPAKKSGLQRVVLFGDSRALSWPAPEAEETLSRFEFINRGIGQQTSEQIRLRFAEHVQPLHADLIVLQLCVNDLKAIPLFPVRSAAIIEQCKHNLQALVQAARANGSKVLLTTVFPLGEVPLEHQLLWSDAVAPAIREVNLYIHTLRSEGVEVLDTFSLLQDQPDLIRPAYSRDLLHLNAAGYEVLNQALGTWLRERM